MLPEGPFDIIVADPPWRFASNSKARPGRNAMRHYECLPLPEIKALPVPAVAARDSLLLLWATSPMLPHALEVMAAWGFKYKSSLIWAKSRIGTGFWAQNRHELVLIGRRGRFPCPRPAPFSDSIIQSPNREHSRKPDELQDRVDAVWPQTRKLEMFARTPRLGWAQFGNEIGKFQVAAE